MLHWFAMAAVLCLVTPVSRAETVVLENGDKLEVEIVEREADHIVIEHPQLGQIRLSIDQVQIVSEDPPNPGLFGTQILKGWSRTLDVGINGKKGNSESTTITSGLDMGYEDKYKRWAVRGRTFYDRDEDGPSDNDGQFTVRRDHLLPGSPWFVFGNVRYAYDKFESWKHRIVPSVGPGYHLIDRNNHKVDVRLAPSYTREFGERDSNQLDAMFAIDYSWKLGDRFTLSFSNQLFKEIQPDWEEVRNLTIADWKMKVLENPPLSLKAGVENEYESDVEEDDKKNDLKYYLSIGIDF